MVSGSLVVALLVVFCLVSTKRLAAYESEMGLWLEVLQSQPNNSMAHHGVAAILEKEGNDEAAMEHYRAAAESGPASSHAHYQLGTLYHKQGDYVEAANHFSEAIRSMPRKHVTATMQNNRAVALYSAGRNDEAIAAFHAALAIDPSDWSAHRNLSTALRKADKYAESIDELKAALRLNPRAIELYNELAKSYRHLDQQPEARAALRQGLKLAQAAGDTENTNRFNAALNAQQ
jgi:tetratricopeptide (TPR) repeat protein